MIGARASGILLHPTSLPGPAGIGDLGAAARRFVDFLAAAGQRRWQILPLGPTGFGNSPYSAHSSFAGNPLLIAPDLLVADGHLDPDAPGAPDLGAGPVDYDAARRYKNLLLARAFDRFERHPPAGAVAGFEAFCRSAEWLDDYALFSALKGHYGGAPWRVWEAPLRDRAPAALERWRDRLRRDMEQARFAQYLFFSQWSRLKDYAGERGVRIIGDLPIFVPEDSADVWAHRSLFQLEGDGVPTVVAGVPPDYFSATGQLWGNPVYRWEAHAETGYAWWAARVGAALELVDLLRLDHFRGFVACWEVPAGAPDATHGHWAQGPGRDLFAALDKALGETAHRALIAEDLGLITEDVTALRRSLGLPGMAVLQFAFDGVPDNPHLPAHHERVQVVYTGTHDNDTAVGWFAGLDEATRARVLAATGGDGGSIHRDLADLALGSVADTAVVPLQDVVGLGPEARMNRPGSPHDNWCWRALPEHLSDAVARDLLALARRHDRA